MTYLPDSSAPRLEGRGLSRRYGRRRALIDVSFACAGGEAVALVGPNGAGKSTLLAVLSTLARPTSGTVWVDGVPAATGGPTLRRRFGFLGHDIALYPDLTARENLLFFGRLYGVLSPSLDARVSSALTSAGLDERADTALSTFSRGMRQRLAIERALLHAPDILLLDEPFTGLDERAADGLASRLVTLRQSGVAIVFSSHDFEHAEHVATRVSFVSSGRVSDLAGAGSLRARYRAATSGRAS